MLLFSAIFPVFRLVNHTVSKWMKYFSLLIEGGNVIELYCQSVNVTCVFCAAGISGDHHKLAVPARRDTVDVVLAKGADWQLGEVTWC